MDFRYETKSFIWSSNVKRSERLHYYTVIYVTYNVEVSIGANVKLYVVRHVNGCALIFLNPLLKQVEISHGMVYMSDNTEA